MLKIVKLLAEKELNIEKYQNALRAINQDALADTSSMPSALRMYPQSGGSDAYGISVYYAPFEHVNRSARIVLVGITPGESQMRRAWCAARHAITTGEEISKVMSEVKRVSSFNDEFGNMRRNLYRQIEHWSVHTWLGLSTGASLFDEGWSQVQTTSLIRFPTFLYGNNYRGQSPIPLKHDFLSSVINAHLINELRAIPKAIVFPLGPKVESVIRKLEASKLISNPIQYGMFHPSGENTYRFDYLCGERHGPPRYRTDPRAYDKGRKDFYDKYLASTPIPA